MGNNDLEEEDKVKNVPGNLLNELIQLLVYVGDVVMGGLQSIMLGSTAFWTDTMISNTDDNLGAGVTGKQDSGSWLYAGEDDVKKLSEGEISDRGASLIMVERERIEKGFFSDSYEVPNIMYSPENIFSNKIPALDANFINPHEYSPMIESRDDEEGEQEQAANPTSLAETIAPTISSFYKSIRNIAIVGLLSVLVYIGIRILIGTVAEKAKYKERFQDWLVALCMVFFMHFIMAGIFMVSEKIIGLVGSMGNTGIIVSVDDGCVFRTTFVGLIRFLSQSQAWTEGVGYGIMYFILIGITLRYTFIYLKRALYLAFFTVISPLVALTYPIDKISDEKAQAFNIWIKEYFINAIIQPVHLVLYSILVGASISLAVTNPIYGIVVLLFLPTAEAWIKRMFKMDRAELSSNSLGDVALMGTMLGLGSSIAKGAGRLGTATVGAIATGPIGTATKNAVGAARTKIREKIGRSSNAKNPTANGKTGSSSQPLPFGSADDIAKQQQSIHMAKNNNSGHGGIVLQQGNSQKATNMSSSIPPIPGGGPQGTTILNNVNRNNDVDLDSLSTANNQKEEDEDKKEKAQERLKAKAEKSTDNPYVKELKDLLKSGAAGALTGVAALPFSAMVAGATAETKLIPTGVLGGAHIGATVTADFIKKGDEVINNKINTLVKSDLVSNPVIIRQAAEMAKEKGWSDEKMTIIAQMAQDFKDLKNDTQQRKDLNKKLEELGVDKSNANAALQDIIKLQEKVNKLEDKKNEQKEKERKNWV